MKSIPLLPALALAMGVGLAPAPLLAANADAPHQNVDKSNDAGNSTGNAQVDRLNGGQLGGSQQPAANQGAAAPSQPTAGSPQQK